MSDPALYVHLPFCETKCPYCDFNSFAIRGRDVDGYFEALRLEMDARGVPRDPPTLFVGGGTPTVVEADRLERFLRDLRDRLRPRPEREFTVEANPGSLTPDKIALLVEHGVTRVSLGAQALFDRHLRTLGRVHDVAQIGQALSWLREAGIAGISLDLIYAVPGMTVREWNETLTRCLDWKPGHLSCYALTFEPGTEFHARRRAGRLSAAPEEVELAMFRLTERRLRQAGLRRYEISNFARPGLECRHNLTYWRNESYVGFGAGAYSYVGGERKGNERDLDRYAAAVRERGDAAVVSERREGFDGASEMIALGLRTAEGVDLEQVASRFGVDVRGRFGERIARLVAGGFLEAGGRLRLARRGWRLADEVAQEFL